MYHPDTAASYKVIGAVMQAMGDNVCALKMLKKALAIREKKVLEKEHPDTAVSYNVIGHVMQAMGDNVGALEMYNKACS